MKNDESDPSGSMATAGHWRTGSPGHASRASTGHCPSAGPLPGAGTSKTGNRERIISSLGSRDNFFGGELL